MTDLRKAAKEALEALEEIADEVFSPYDNKLGDAILALRAALAQQEEPVEPVAWKQGNLVTFNEDPYPALGGLFVQFWDGEEVAARVYANDLETLRQRCAKVNTAPPQRKPLTEEEIDRICALLGFAAISPAEIVRAVERAHGIGETK